MWIVITTDRINESATGNKASFGHITGTDNHLPGIGRYLIRIAVEIAHHAIHLHRLVDIRRNDAIVISFLAPILVVAESTFVAEEQRPLDIAFNGILIG